MYRISCLVSLRPASVKILVISHIQSSQFGGQTQEEGFPCHTCQINAGKQVCHKVVCQNTYVTAQVAVQIKSTQERSS